MNDKCQQSKNWLRNRIRHKHVNDKCQQKNGLEIEKVSGIKQNSLNSSDQGNKKSNLPLISTFSAAYTIILSKCMMVN